MDLPIELQQWTTAQCADYFHESSRNFLTVTRFRPGFPKPLATSEGKRPLWSAKAVINWALGRCE